MPITGTGQTMGDDMTYWDAMHAIADIITMNLAYGVAIVFDQLYWFLEWFMRGAPMAG